MGLKIGAMIELKDKFTSQFQSIAKKSKKEIRTIKTSFNSLKKSLSNIGKKVAVGVGIAVAATVKYMKDSLQAYQDQNRAVVAMTNSLKKQKGMTNEVIQATLKHAEIIQAQGVVGDEILQMGMNELAIYGLKADQIKLLTSNIGDMLVKEKGMNATMDDSMAAGKALTKALSGRVKGLQTYGVYLSDSEQKAFKLMNTEKRVMFLNKKLEEAIGGSNKVLRDTPEGIGKALANDFGDVQEVVGEELQPTLVQLGKGLLSNMPKIKEQILELVHKLAQLQPIISNGLNMAIKLAIGTVDTLFQSINYVANNWGWIKYVAASILGLTGVFKIYNGIMRINGVLQAALTIAKNAGIVAEATTYSSIMKSIGAFLLEKGVMIGSTVITWGMTAATWALNTALAILTSPITLVVGAIAGLTAGAYYLYQNFDWVKSKIGELWTAFKNSGPIQTLIDWFQSLMTYIKPVLDIINKLRDGISGIVGAGIDKIKGFFRVGKSKEIPKHAMGTPYFSGGLTTINERGGELINLPNGSQIIPHDLSKKIINNKTSNANITININGAEKNSKEIAYEAVSMINKYLGLEGGNVFG